MSAFDKVIGYDSLKVELKIVCDAMKNPDKYRALGVTTPKGVLLYGEPGIGKSLMAEAIIAESGRTAFTIRKDKPDGEFVNYIRETFERAQAEVFVLATVNDKSQLPQGI